MNKMLQVGLPRMMSIRPSKSTLVDTKAGHQHPKHEHRAGGPDVQELPIKRAIPPGGSVHLGDGSKTSTNYIG